MCLGITLIPDKLKCNALPSFASATESDVALSAANLASIPTTAAWSAPLMISDTDADVGKHNVWTRILLSPRDEVYSNAAWKATSRESLRSSVTYNERYIDFNIR